MHAVGPQPRRAPDGAPAHAERHRSERTTLYRLVQQQSAANLDIRLHCLVPDGVYRCGADGVPGFIEAGAPSDDELHALLQTIIARLMKMLRRRGVLVEDMGQTYLAEPGANGEEGRTLKPLQAAAITHRIAFGPARRTRSCARRWCRGDSPLRRKRPPKQRSPPGAKSTQSWPGCAASAGHGCSSASSTSTCSAARTAATGNSGSLLPF